MRLYPRNLALYHQSFTHLKSAISWIIPKKPLPVLRGVLFLCDGRGVWLSVEPGRVLFHDKFFFL